MSEDHAGMPASRKNIAATQRGSNPWSEFVADDGSEEELCASDWFLDMLCKGAKSWKDDR
jgi:hypothetical protein